MPPTSLVQPSTPLGGYRPSATRLAVIVSGWLSAGEADARCRQLSELLSNTTRLLSGAISSCIADEKKGRRFPLTDARATIGRCIQAKVLPHLFGRCSG